jgi:bis(5'-nucleosyl)-tetraphosphatase (symmetrical)
MAIYAVGDIQGCYDPLQRVLDAAAFNPSRDTLWSVGDLINRGPQSLETLRFLKGLGSRFTGVLGNHDLHFLAAWSGAQTQGKFQTLQALLHAPDCDELAQWLRTLPLAHRATVATTLGDTDFLMVHAGLAPGWSFEQTSTYSREVETALRGDNFIAYLKAMYGDQPDVFRDTLTGMERLRVLTNVLTRIRFCSIEGKLDLQNKDEAASAAPGYSPWFDFQLLQPAQKILFGHWAMLNGVTGRDDIIGLDTGCVWGRRMTLLRLDDGEKFCVNCA